MNLGPNRVAHIKPTRTGEEMLTIVFHWVFEQCLTYASICLFMLSSGIIYSDTLPHSSWKVTLARWGACEKHSPNLFFSSLQISSPNLAVGKLNHEAALIYQHIIIIIIIIINLYLYTKSYQFYMVFVGIVCKN